MVGEGGHSDRTGLAGGELRMTVVAGSSAVRLGPATAVVGPGEDARRSCKRWATSATPERTVVGVGGVLARLGTRLGGREVVRVIGCVTGRSKIARITLALCSVHLSSPCSVRVCWGAALPRFGHG